jgi:hypothetical protein
MIVRIKEIVANPNPALGYFNRELRFWLGWAQEVAGDENAAKESWEKPRWRLVRHPIYTGLLAMVVATAIQQGHIGESSD